MKRKVRLAILGAMLHGSAHAAEPGATAEPSLSKGQVTHPASSAEKKTRAVRIKKSKPKARIDSEKAKPQETVKQEVVTETPPEAIEQSVQLRGVRG